ncbi:MAG TPA: oligosaccharide flippase family protein [Rhodocyclaceae bacterium]|nr:oligosaccharide flippase family protein [Rhodocyclaceae bacterium]
MNMARGITRRDALWTVATTGTGAVLQLIQLMVAARYLDAHAFGALAIVNIVVWVVLAFQDMGLSSFCVHLGEVPRSAHSTLFWTSSALGLMGALIVAALAYPLALFYRIPELAYLLPLLSLNFLLIGLGAQYQANLIRTFRARRLAQFELVARLAGFAVAVGLLVGYEAGAEAVVFGLITFSLAKLVLVGVAADNDWHPTNEFDRALAPRALRYGAYQASAQVINQLRTQADQLILGRALGPEYLGIYALARELIAYPLRFLQPLFSRLVLPVLARDQHSPEKLRSTFCRSMKQTAIVSAAIYGLLACAATWIVEIMYGERFLAVAALVPLLAVFGALRPLGLNIGMLAQATGRTADEFRWNVLASMITISTVLLVAVLWPSLTAFAITASALQLILSLLSYPCFVRPLQSIGVWAYMRTWGASFAAAVVVATIAYQFPLPSMRALGVFPDEVLTRIASMFGVI